MSEERALIRRAAGGEPGALEALAIAHRPIVLRTAQQLLADRDLAEDVTQDVFVRLQAALPGFRGDAALSTWLHRVTVNVCRDHLRRARGRTAELQDLTDDERLRVHEHPDRSVDVERARTAVREAIARLPDDQREAVMLRYIMDLPYEEISRITATPLGTVASRVFRALARIGQDLEDKHLEVVQ